MSADRTAAERRAQQQQRSPGGRVAALLRLLRSETASMMVIYSLGMSTFVGMAAIVLDFGMHYSETRHLQNAADAAALAAVRQLSNGTAAATAQAYTYLAHNDVTDDANTTITVTMSYGGDPNSVYVQLARSRRSILGSFFDVDELHQRVGAVATRTEIPGAGSYSIVVLSDSGCRALVKSGNADIDLSSSAIMVNSTCDDDAADLSGNGDVTTQAFEVMGGVDIDGNVVVFPPPTQAAAPVTDPLAGLEELDPEDYPQRSTGGPTNPRTTNIGGTVTLEPGTYYGGIQFSGSGTKTLNAGVYIMAGGGFKTAGSGSLVSNGPVLIFNTDAPDGRGAAADCGPIHLTGGMDIDLTPYVTAPYTDMTFWQAADCDETLTVNGGHTSVIGVFYAPGGTINISGGGDLGPIQMMAEQITLTGNADLTITSQGFVGSQTEHRWWLSE